MRDGGEGENQWWFFSIRQNSTNVLACQVRAWDRPWASGNLLPPTRVQRVGPPAQGQLRKERAITMYYLRSIAGILVLLVCVLSACGSQSPTIAETSQPEDEEERSPEQLVTDTAPVAPTATPTEPPSAPTEGSESPLPTPPLPVAPTVDAGETRRVSPVPLPVEPGPIGGPEPAPGEVPEDLLTNILTDLQEREGLGREEIVIERAEAVVWRDGSLGCPKPGMMYLQVLTPGYFVVLRVGDDLYNYHAGESGSFLLCEQSLPGEILPPGDSTGPFLEE